MGSAYSEMGQVQDRRKSTLPQNLAHLTSSGNNTKCFAATLHISVRKRLGENVGHLLGGWYKCWCYVSVLNGVTQPIETQVKVCHVATPRHRGTVVKDRSQRVLCSLNQSP